MRLFRKKTFVPDDYEPVVMKWRASLAPFIKARLAPEKSRRRWWWNRLFVQVHDQYFFHEETREAIFQSLQPAAGRSQEILGEAEALLAEEDARRDRVEQRSVGLQGAVAIAAGFGLAGAGLILDPSKLPTTGWRIAVGASYLFTLTCLAGTGFRALRATVRVHAFESPDPEGPVKRAGMTSEESNLHRAAEVLYTYGRNQALGDYKVTQMRASGHWFSGALVGLLLTAILACAALLDHPSSHAVSHGKTNAARRGRVTYGRTFVRPAGNGSLTSPTANSPSVTARAAGTTTSFGEWAEAAAALATITLAAVAFAQMRAASAQTKLAQEQLKELEQSRDPGVAMREWFNDIQAQRRGAQPLESQTRAINSVASALRDVAAATRGEPPPERTPPNRPQPPQAPK